MKKEILEHEESLYIDQDDIGAENEEDINQENSKYSDAVVWGTDWTAETIDLQLKKNNIDLFPKFQRRDAWSNTDKSRFIESLVLGLPIPQIILAEKNDSKGKYIVIDGKQRLLTIRKFFSMNDEEFKPLKLSGLEIIKKLNGKTYKQLKDDPDFAEEIDQLENRSIRTVVIKNWEDESFLYTVFLRLNTGSKKLSPQELRQALHPGPFIDFADEFSATEKTIMEMLNLKKPDYRMRDVELVIRYFAFRYFLDNYDGNLKDFFDNTVKDLNKSWSSKELRLKEDGRELSEAISFTFELFGDTKSAFSKWNGKNFQRNFNRAIFDIMVYYFSKEEIRNEASRKKTEILDMFKNLCEKDSEFLNSFEHTTKSIKNTFKRLTTWGEKLANILDVQIEVPYNADGDFEIKKI